MRRTIPSSKPLTLLVAVATVTMILPSAAAPISAAAEPTDLADSPEALVQAVRAEEIPDPDHEASLDRVEQVRDRVATGRLVEAVRAGAGLADIPVVEPEAEPVRADLPAAVPTGLVVPVAEVVAARQAAADRAEAAIPADADLAGPGELPALLLRPEMARADDAGATVDPLAASGTSVPVRPEPVDRARLQAVRTAATDDVDRRGLVQGALRMAQAIDGQLPRLRAHAATASAPADAGPVAGCDVADDPPHLCIGGAGDNVYTDDYAVQIDLGGDDIYRNAPGSADPGLVHAGAGNGLFAATAIDLGGNDTYETEPGRFTEGGDGAVLVQGAGVGGIGFLVDAGDGDDRYRAATSRDGRQALGQGMGIVGVGVLADRGGDDLYELSATTGSAVAVGQAAGSEGAVGVLLDQGAGDDAYRIATAPDPVTDTAGRVYPSPSLAKGLGAASLAAGAVFSDGGGADRMTLDGSSRPVAADDPRPQKEVLAVGIAWGGGFAFLGSGAVALTGDGPTSWSVLSAVSAPRSGQRQVKALGYASLFSFAALSDAGGDDVYDVRATSDARRKVEVDDSCECRGAAAKAEAGEDPRGQFLVAYSAFAAAIGDSGLYSRGILRDVAGDDRYTIRAEGQARAVARDNRTRSFDSAGEIGAYAEAIGGVTEASGQGSGLLVDTAGDDVYRATSTSRADADATAERDDVPETGKAVAGPSHVKAQGFSGWLIDVGGADRYDARSNVSARADPPSEVVEEPYASRFWVQAAGIAGVLVDLDDGDGGLRDTFTTSPELPPLHGTRGDGVWIDYRHEFGGAPEGPAVGVNDDTSKADAGGLD